VNCQALCSPTSTALTPDHPAVQYVQPPIYTVTFGAAFGNACMLLAAGKKGKRFSLPHTQIKMAPPRINRSFGPTVDMMIKSNELEETNETYVRFMSKFTGKTQEQVRSAALHMLQFKEEHVRRCRKSLPFTSYCLVYVSCCDLVAGGTNCLSRGRR
jgi:hypothetical protein